VLTIGHAIGGTPYAALLAAAGGAGAEARVRSIEIVAPVYEAVRAHAARPDGPPVLRAMLADPRIERVLGDGRHAIFADKTRRWDVIEADAMLPRSSHSGLLYSVAFFREVRDSLKPGGIAVQWEPTPRTLASFLAAFPHVVRLDAGHGRGAVLLGSPDRPVPFDREALTRRLEAVMPAMEAASWRAAELRNLLLEAPVEVWGPRDPRPGEVNTDLFPKDEYFLNRWKLDLLGQGAAGR
jgi:spermidine synthase